MRAVRVKPGLPGFPADDKRRAEALAAAARCIAFLKDRYGAKRAFVFGSAAGAGPWHAGSDLDLAVEGLATVDFWQAWDDLERLVPPWLEVDLFPLERMHPEARAYAVGEVEMPKDPYAALAQRIQDELRSLERVVSEGSQLLRQVGAEPTFVELRAAGSIVEDFYSGTERLFERVAIYLDGGVPSGEEWHKELLQQMAGARPEGRPPVISAGLADRLDAYRRFRHRARHIYGFELEWPRVQELAEGMGPSFEALRQQLTSFEAWLHSQSEGQGETSDE